MISFKGRNEAIRNADRITRAVNSIYPHISESRAKIYIEKRISKENSDRKKCYKLSGLKLKNSLKIDNLRYRCNNGFDEFRNVIDMLKNHHLGNCYENAVLAEIIGKINGVKNIYPAKIFFTRNNSGMNMQLDHAVAIITKKPLEKDLKYSLKDTEAIIIDSWFGITEFVGNYFNRIRNEFADKFPLFSDSPIRTRWILNNVKTPKEFNKKRREMIFRPDFFIKIHDDVILHDKETQILKHEYPELVFLDKKRTE